MALLLSIAAVPATAALFMIVVVDLVKDLDPPGKKKRRRRKRKKRR